MPTTYDNIKLVAEQILDFASHPNMFRKVKNLPPNFKLIA